MLMAPKQKHETQVPTALQKECAAGDQLSKKQVSQEPEQLHRDFPSMRDKRSWALRVTAYCITILRHTLRL